MCEYFLIRICNVNCKALKKVRNTGLIYWVERRKGVYVYLNDIRPRLIDLSGISRMENLSNPPGLDFTLMQSCIKILIINFLIQYYVNFVVIPSHCAFFTTNLTSEPKSKRVIFPLNLASNFCLPTIKWKIPQEWLLFKFYSRQ